MDKRGSLSIETIIIIILALLVLIILTLSFTGGMQSLWATIRGATPAQMTLDTAIANCNDVCNKALKADTFCSQSYVVVNVGIKACKDLVPCKWTC